MARGSALRGAAAGGTLQVRGLAELQRDMRKVSRSANSEIRDGLKDVGRIVSERAKIVALSKGLHKTGDLARKITPTVRQQGVFVQAKAKRRSPKYPGGYPYPAVYEYGMRRGRPFLVPALESSTNEVERAMEHWLNTFLSKNDL